MITRRRVLSWHGAALAQLSLGPALIVAAVDGVAQAQARTVRIAWLVAVQAPPGGGRYRAHTIFLDRLRELGWIEGTNLVIDTRYAGGRSEPLPALAAELIALRPDLIITAGTMSTRALRDATSTIPIVMAGGGDPVGSGLVARLARPGGNITGVSLLGQEIIPKALSLLHEVVPQARRIDLLGNAANPASPFFAPNFQRIADAAIKRRLPLANTAGRDYTAAGSLFSYSVNNDEVFRMAAVYADRILRGAKPAEMPIEQPSRYELVINLKTAKTLGISVPQSVLVRADEVIE